MRAREISDQPMGALQQRKTENSAIMCFSRKPRTQRYFSENTAVSKTRRDPSAATVYAPQSFASVLSVSPGSRVNRARCVFFEATPDISGDNNQVTSSSRMPRLVVKGYYLQYM